MTNGKFGTARCIFVLFLTVCAVVLAHPRLSSAVSEQVIYSFAGIPDGSAPYYGDLIADARGVLYGTTLHGGTGSCASSGTVVGCGTVFSLTPPRVVGGAWSENVLYSFAGGTTDGQFPTTGLVVKNGVLYGTTSGGGPATGNCGTSGEGCGTVFSLTPPVVNGGPWTESVLYIFTGGSDGGEPQAGVLANKNGALYGTASLGGRLGSPNCIFNEASGCGVVFALMPPATAGRAWTERALYAFIGGNDGENPVFGLINKNGVLYGTTAQGGGLGSSTCSDGCGIAFALIPPSGTVTSWTESILHRFGGVGDGAEPFSKLVAAQGALYGTTIAGCSGFGCGCSGIGCGTVFALTPPTTINTPWTEAVLYSFGGGADGAEPFGSILVNDDGAIYGTTTSGGTANSGTVFKLIPPRSRGSFWTDSILYSFTGGSDGDAPLGGLLPLHRAIYGTTIAGGVPGCSGFGCGTVFALTE